MEKFGKIGNGRTLVVLSAAANCTKHERYTWAGYTATGQMFVKVI